MSEPITIGEITVSGPLMNASGALSSTEEQLKFLDETDGVSVVVTKSCTFEPQKLREHTYIENAMGSINNLGQGNLGHKVYQELCGSFHKTYMISVAWDHHMEHVLTELDCTIEHPDLVEIQIPDYYNIEDIIFICDTLEAIAPCYDYGLKLPPCTDRTHLNDVASILNEHEISFVTCCNSVNNGLIFHEGQPIIGNVGGKYLKPLSLGNVYLLRSVLDPEIKIIGCGGISTGQDVQEYLSAGACTVQIGTQLIKEGTSCFSRILEEMHK